MAATFHWHSETRIAQPARDLAALRDAVIARAGLRAGRDGVTVQDGADLLCETSGSGGVPKVIRRSVASWQASFAVNGARLALGPETCVAFFSGFGASLALYGALEGAHHGACLLSLAEVAPHRWARTLAARRASTLYVTPTQLALVCRAGTRLPDVRHILVGGGRLSPATETAARACAPGAEVIHFYGAAETSFVTWSDAATPPGSVGHPYPGVDLRVDADGLIWVRSPYLFTDYASGSSKDTLWRDGYLSVGEVGRLDADGHLFVLGRASRMVTIADRNVFPETAEAWLAARLPQVGAAVVAVPDRVRGARLVACLAGPGDALTDDALLRDARASLGPHDAPHRILRLAALPLLPSGKPDLVALTRRAANAA